jgi:hypothetical protein
VVVIDGVSPVTLSRRVRGRCSVVASTVGTFNRRSGA